MSIEIRVCRLPDDLNPLTDLLHRAYAELAAAGLRYVASHQTPEMTEKRVRAGTCFVAEESGVIVGTISVRPSNPNAQIPAYRAAGTMMFGQFGVDPRCRGRGIGRTLHDHVFQFAKEQGATILALDTAAPAVRLIETYQKWGYQEIDVCRWESTNYESVVMAKLTKAPNQLDPDNTVGRPPESISLTSCARSPRRV